MRDGTFSLMIESRKPIAVQESYYHEANNKMVGQWMVKLEPRTDYYSDFLSHWLLLRTKPHIEMPYYEKNIEMILYPSRIWSRIFRVVYFVCLRKCWFRSIHYELEKQLGQKLLISMIQHMCST